MELKIFSLKMSHLNKQDCKTLDMGATLPMKYLKDADGKLMPKI